MECFVQKYSKLWCIVQKHFSGIVTCYTAIKIDYLDLTNASDQFSFVCSFLGFVQKYYYPEILHLGILVQGLFLGNMELAVILQI